MIQYEQDISDAETDIGRTEDVIDNLLIPRRQQIQKKIDSITDNMEFNRKTLAEDTLLREQDHAAYEAAVAEYNEGIANVDEAIELLQSITNPSLMQIKKFQQSINKVAKKTW